MIELSDGMLVNLSQIIWVRVFRDTYTVQFNGYSIAITKEDYNKIKSVSDMGMSILNEVSKTVL